MGWNLGVGGVITRRANGKIDEYYYAGDPYISNPEHYSFLYNKDKLLGDAWVTNNEGNPGELDLAPDEFQFTVNGLSGTFFLDGNGKLLVKTAANEDIKVDYELKNSPELANFYYPEQKAKIPRIFYKFTLTATDGTKYVFGNDKDAIEYSRSSSPDRYFGGISVANLPPDDGGIIATSWYLKEIIAPGGKTISFEYTRNGYQLIESKLFQVGRHSSEGCNNGAGYEDLKSGTVWSRNLINSVYLKSITGYEGTTIHFETSESNQLSQGQPIDGNGETFFEGYYDLLFTDPSQYKNKMLQLDKIIVKYNGAAKKQVRFEYTSAATERLKLLNVNVSGSMETTSQQYVFGYNLTKLPAYNTGQSDHWGYYNKPDYFFTVNSFTVENASAKYPSYLAYLEPDLEKAQAEILTSITYPTGGQTLFNYELNNYSSQVTVAAGAFAVEDLSQNKDCSGLRIAEIISDPLNSGVPIKKVYKYVKDYASNGTASSGILTGKPDYWVSGSYKSKGRTSTGIGDCTIDNNFWMFSSQGYEPLSNANGSHIGYSEVAEINADGSYKIFKYSNYDDPALVDQFPVNLKTSFNLNSTNSLFFKTLCFTKMGFERGQLLKELVYDASKQLKQEVTYTYNTDPARYTSYGRAVETYHLPLIGAFSGTIAIVKTVSCTKKYLFNPNVTKIETKTYESNGTATAVEQLVYNLYGMFLNVRLQIAKVKLLKSNSYIRWIFPRVSPIKA